MNLSISVVIATKDRSEDLITFLDSLNKQSCLPQECIIVDASDKNEEELYKKKLHSDIKFVYIPASPGLTIQRNIGINSSHGDVVFFFDDDVILESEYLEEAMKIYAEYEHCGGVVGKITNIGRLVQNWKYKLMQLLCYFFQVEYYDDRGQMRKSGLKNDFYFGNTVQSIQSASGCCMSFRKNILKQVGMFDENLVGYSYMEDVDIGFRVSRIASVYFCPMSKCVHNQSPNNRLKDFENGKMFMINWHYLFRKNLPQRIDYLLSHYMAFFFLIVMHFYNFRFRRLAGMISGAKSILFKQDKLSKIIFS